MQSTSHLPHVNSYHHKYYTTHNRIVCSYSGLFVLDWLSLVIFFLVLNTLYVSLCCREWDVSERCGLPVWVRPELPERPPFTRHPRLCLRSPPNCRHAAAAAGPTAVSRSVSPQEEMLWLKACFSDLGKGVIFCVSLYGNGFLMDH